jgi:transposase
MLSRIPRRAPARAPAQHPWGRPIDRCRAAGRDPYRRPLLSPAFAAHSGTAPLPAPGGLRQRHRLNRGGSRRLKRALFAIASVQARWEPRARVYLERKRAEGKSAAEARRCSMRHLAVVVYRAMVADHQSTPTTPLRRAA